MRWRWWLMGWLWVTWTDIFIMITGTPNTTFLKLYCFVLQRAFSSHNSILTECGWAWIAPRALAKQWHKIIVLFSIAPLDSLREIMRLLYKWWVTVNSREMSQGITWHHKVRKDRVWVLFPALRTIQSIFFLFCRCLLCELHNYFYQCLILLYFLFFPFSH
jgi:hypothetical protein